MLKPVPASTLRDEFDQQFRQPANQNPETSGGGPSYPFSSRLKLSHNEKTKLSATAANNIGVAFVVASIIVPLVGFTQNPTLPINVVSLLLSLIWLLTGAGIHAIGRLILNGLEP